MMGTYLTGALVYGIGLSYLGIIHYFWLRHVFKERPAEAVGGSHVNQPSIAPRKTRIVILGGGFAGVNCAQTLRRALSPAEAEIVLFNHENHLVFTPLLAEVIGAAVNPLDVVVSLRQLLPGVSCMTEEVTGIDPPSNEIEYHSSDGQTCRLKYDHLVLA